MRRRTEQADRDAPQLRAQLVVQGVVHKHDGGRRKHIERRPVVRLVGIRELCKRQVHRRQQRHFVNRAIHAKGDRRRRACVERERRLLLQEAPVPSTELAEDPHRRV